MSIPSTADGADERVLTASILHADLDAFYASVEQRDHPALRGRPVIVGGGVVLAASYEAKRHGVKTAMNERQARELCPGAVVVPPRFEAYTDASRDVFAVFDDTSPLVEGLSIDEAFIDVSGLRRIAGTPEQIAVQLRSNVRERVGLAITVGVARTKFLAKVASAVGKPDGLLVVEPHLESEFLHPLPVQALWGVGPVTAEKLRQRGLHTVGEVASLSQSQLIALVGKAGGRHLHALARHRDPRPVEVGRRRRSIGSQQALGRGRRSEAELTALLHGITDRVTRRLRNASRLCRTVVLRLRFGDFTRATRSRSIQWPTSATGPIQGTALTLLDEALPTIEERGITLIGLSLTNLSEDNGAQLTLPLDDADVDVEARSRGGSIETRRRHDAIDETLDDITHRFGAASLTRASLLGKTTGFEMPKLPD